MEGKRFPTRTSSSVCLKRTPNFTGAVRHDSLISLAGLPWSMKMPWGLSPITICCRVMLRMPTWSSSKHELPKSDINTRSRRRPSTAVLLGRQRGTITNHYCPSLPAEEVTPRVPGTEDNCIPSLSRRSPSHPGIESAIRALQFGNGLERCRDRTEVRFDRHAPGILGRNLQVLGKLLIQQTAPDAKAADSQRKSVA